MISVSVYVLDVNGLISKDWIKIEIDDDQTCFLISQNEKKKIEIKKHKVTSDFLYIFSWLWVFRSFPTASNNRGTERPGLDVGRGVNLVRGFGVTGFGV